MRRIPARAASFIALGLLGLLGILGCGGGSSAPPSSNPSTNHPPAFSTSPPLAAKVGTLYTYAPQATDPDGDPVAISMVGGATGSQFSAGALSWTPTTGEAGRAFQFNLRAEDGRGGTADQTWAVTPSAPGPLTNAFTATGSMIQARTRHSATLLPNGKVLVMGGEGLVSGRLERLSSVELYDPASGTFSPVGNLSLGTSEHTATLLSDGTVLVIGGRDNGSLASARVERFNPATGRSTLQNGLNHARLKFHTATLLPSGKVLVVGGASRPEGDADVAAAEVYDPDAPTGLGPARKGRSTDTGDLRAPRHGHHAMLLPWSPNHVLIMGGGTTVFERYTIDTGLIDSKDFPDGFKQAGGSISYLGQGRWLSAGGLDTSTRAIRPDAAIFDAFANGGDGGFSSTGSMPTPRFLGGAISLQDGRVLITGGASELTAMTVDASGVVFDPAANKGAGTFTPASNNMSSPRFYHTMTLLPNGRVLIVGGQTKNDDQSQVASADLYD